MRNKLPYLFTLLIGTAIFIASCSNHSELTATQTADKFMTAIQFGDFKEARNYASDETADLLKYQNPSFNRPFQDGYELIREEVNGDYAKVFYTVPDEEEEKFVRLKRSGKGWLVIMSKSELRPGNIFDSLDDNLGGDEFDDYDTDDFSPSSEEDKEEMKEMGQKFLDALEKGDIKEAMSYAEMQSDEWLFINGDDDEHLALYKDGTKVTGHLTFGSKAKVLYKIPGKEGTYQLKMIRKSGTWFVAYEGPEKWEGMENAPKAVKDLEEATEEFGKSLEKTVEKAFEDAFTK